MAERAEWPERHYDWRERRFEFSDSERGRRAPAGKVWSIREMFSYSTGIEEFTTHLKVMASGLEDAYFTTYDCDDSCGWDQHDEDDYGMFVVGLRPATDADKTASQRHAEQKEANERAEFERLKEKYANG